MQDDSTSPVVGVVTGGSRAVAAQFFSLYIRVPVKLFKPARIDYLKLLKHAVETPAQGPYTIWTHSSIALLVRAVREHGWRFIPDKLMPPIIANSVVGAVLYTSYLASLQVLEHTKKEPRMASPIFANTFIAGGVAGAAQAAVATPLDAIAMRFDVDVITSQTNLWKYGWEQLRDLGLRPAYGGILLNLVKESTSFALFFSTFEFVKGPMYKAYSSWWYAPSYFHPKGRKESKIIFPTFVLLGGCCAGLAMQLVAYPLSKIQKLHTIRLQAIDATVLKGAGWAPYLHSYPKTLAQLQKQVRVVAHGSWLSWLYGGLGKYVLYSMPSTSIGLLVFEIMRIRYIGGSAPFDEEAERSQTKKPLS